MRGSGKQVWAIGLLSAALALGGCGHLETQKAELVKEISPPYPEMARREGLEGRVVLEYTISEEGFPVDIRIVESTPPGIFDAVAINALSQWRYIPARKLGDRVKIPEAEAVFNFQITDGRPEVTGESSRPDG